MTEFYLVFLIFGYPVEQNSTQSKCDCDEIVLRSLHSCIKKLISSDVDDATLLYSSLLYSTLVYSTLLYSSLLYSTLLYSQFYYGPSESSEDYAAYYPVLNYYVPYDPSSTEAPATEAPWFDDITAAQLSAARVTHLFLFVCFFVFL